MDRWIDRKSLDSVSFVSLDKPQQFTKGPSGCLCFFFSPPVIPVAGFLTILCSLWLPYGSFHLTPSVSSVLIR